MKRFEPSLKIVCTTVVACMIYGLIHALVATQVSIIYYAAFYPLPSVLIENPILLGITLGFGTSWWLGLSLGLVLSFACRKGNKPKLEWKDLIKPLWFYLRIALSCTAIAGTVGYLLSIYGILQLPDAIYHLIMFEEEAGFWAVGFMNITAYLAAFVGSIGLYLWVRATRKRMPVNVSRFN